MTNKVIAIGRIVKDIDIKSYNRQDGTSFSVGNFTVATDTGYGDNKHTDYIDCRLFGNANESLGRYLLKGTLIGVVGAIRVDHYEDKEGNTRKSVYVSVESIDLLSSKSTSNGETRQDRQQYEQDRQVSQQRFDQQHQQPTRPQPNTNDGFPF